MCDNSSLTRLDIRGTDLSNVDPATMGKAVNAIREVIMKNSRLSNEQIKAIFGAFGRHSKLKKLNIKYNGDDFRCSRELAEWADKLEWNSELNAGVSVRYGFNSNYPGSDEYD